MKKWTVGLSFALLIIPQLLKAQGTIFEEVHGLHAVLNSLYNKMVPMCADLENAARAIAGFAATFYIGYRVWKHIANAEPIDFFPLFRPFVLGSCILLFPEIIALANSVLRPTITATQAMLTKTNSDVEALLAKRDEELKKTPDFLMYGVHDGMGDRDLWMLYTHPKEVNDEGLFGSVGNDIEFAMSKAYFNLKSTFKAFLSFALQLLYEAAALCINTIRTFNLLIMALLGPFVFGIAVFDGFTHTLAVYLARYVNYYLWLPIANILGALLGNIQKGMLELDLQQINTYGETFFTSADAGYLIFMIIGIISYMTVPSLSNIIVSSGGGSAITSKVTSIVAGVPSMAAGAGMGAAMGGMMVADRGLGMAADAFGDANLMMTKGMEGHGVASGYFADKLSDKPSGNAKS